MFEAFLVLALANAQPAEAPNPSQLPAGFETMRFASLDGDTPAQTTDAVPLIITIGDAVHPESGYLVPEAAPRAAFSTYDHIAVDYYLDRRWRWYAEHESLQRNASEFPAPWETPPLF